MRAKSHARRGRARSKRVTGANNPLSLFAASATRGRARSKRVPEAIFEGVLPFDIGGGGI